MVQHIIDDTKQVTQHFFDIISNTLKFQYDKMNYLRDSDNYYRFRLSPLLYNCFGFNIDTHSIDTRIIHIHTTVYNDGAIELNREMECGVVIVVNTPVPPYQDPNEKESIKTLHRDFSDTIDVLQQQISSTLKLCNGAGHSVVMDTETCYYIKGEPNEISVIAQYKMDHNGIWTMTPGRDMNIKINTASTDTAGDKQYHDHHTTPVLPSYATNINSAVVGDVGKKE